MKIKGYASAGKAYLIPEIERVEAEREAERRAKEEAERKAREAAEAQEAKKSNAQTFEGKTLNEWSAELNIPVATLRGRIRRGWDIKEALSVNSNKARADKLFEFNGKSQNLQAWSRELGISADTLHGRINRLGWSVEKAFTTKPKSRKVSC